MKAVLTFLCSLAFAIAGIGLAINANKGGPDYGQNTLHAATLPVHKVSELPLDLQLDLEKKYVKHDTVYVPESIVLIKEKSRAKPKVRRAHTLKSTATRQNLRSPAVEPDPIVKNQVCGDREEYSPDTIGPTKESIILVVDGKEVYKR